MPLLLTHVLPPRLSPICLEAIEKLPILWMSPPVIPNLNLSFSPQVDLTLQSRVSDFLRDHARSDAGKAQLSSALNYEVAALEPLPDSAYAPLRELLAASQSAWQTC